MRSGRHSDSDKCDSLQALLLPSVFVLCKSVRPHRRSSTDGPGPAGWMMHTTAKAPPLSPVPLVTVRYRQLRGAVYLSTHCTAKEQSRIRADIHPVLISYALPACHSRTPHLTADAAAHPATFREAKRIPSAHRPRQSFASRRQQQRRPHRAHRDRADCRQPYWLFSRPALQLQQHLLSLPARLSPRPPSIRPQQLRSQTRLLDVPSNEDLREARSGRDERQTMVVVRVLPAKE